jgi:hypothetical protein
MTVPSDRAHDLPRHISAVYRPSQSSEALVYSGDLQLSKNGAEWRSPGQLLLRIGNHVDFFARFKGQEQWISDCAARKGQPPTVSLPLDACLVPESPRYLDVPAEAEDVVVAAECSVPLDRMDGGDVTVANRVLLHLVGHLSDYPFTPYNTADGTVQGQLHFQLPGWDLRLVEVDRHSPTTSFSFVIEAVPDALPIDSSSVTLLRRRLFMLLRFVAGGGVGLGPVVGFDSRDRVVWAAWSGTFIESAGVRWCPDKLVNTALPRLAEGLSSLAREPGLEGCIDRGVSLLLATNEPGIIDTKIVTACSGLELLAWAILQHRQWLTADALGRLSAGASVRLLFQWAGIPVELPDRFSALARRQGRLSQPYWAAPELIFNLRNGLVHPPKNVADPEWPEANELIDAWRLSAWYLELSIIRVLGYSGEYSSRLNSAGSRDKTEPVPWHA